MVSVRAVEPELLTPGLPGSLPSPSPASLSSSLSSSVFAVPSSSVPPPCAVPAFAPLRVRGGRRGRPRLGRGGAGRAGPRRGRVLPAALLALAAASLAVAGGSPPPPPGPEPATAAVPAARASGAARPVSAPVRIADAATVRLLRPGDRVDVIAAPSTALGGGGAARVVARGARVAAVPPGNAARPDAGALVVLSVPRSTAVALAGAGVTSSLAVVLC